MNIDYIILSERRIDQKKLKPFLSFRDKNGHLGSVFLDRYEHTHTTKILNPREKAELLDFLRHDNALSQHKVLTPRRVKKYNIVQLIGDINLKDALPEQFARMNYEKQSMWNINPMGAVLKQDSRIMKALELQREINESLAMLRGDVESVVKEQYDNPKSWKAMTTRHYKALMKAERILRPELEEKRLKISEKRLELNKILAEINSRSKVNLEDNVQEIYLDSKERLFFRRMMNYMDFWDQKWCFLDIEVPLFMTDNPEVSWVGVIFNQGIRTTKEIHCLYPLSVDEFNGYKIYSYKDEFELVKGLKESILREDPFIVSTYNTRFDLIKLREHGDFRIGMHENQPVMKSSMNFFERIGLDGRMVIDLLRWGKTQYKYLINQKLENVAKELLGDERFSKSISYDEMAALELKCKNMELPLEERIEAATTIAEYLCDDVNVMLEIKNSEVFQRGFRHYCRLSQILWIDIPKLMHSPNQANLAQEREYFWNVGNYRESAFMKYSQNIDLEQLAKQRVKIMMKKYLNLNEVKGRVEDVTKVYLPIYPAFFKQVRHPDRFPWMDLVVMGVENEKDKLGKFLLSQYADALCNYLIVDYGGYMRAKEDKIKKGKDLKKIVKRLRRYHTLSEDFFLKVNHAFNQSRKETKSYQSLAVSVRKKLYEIVDELSGQKKDKNFTDEFIEGYISYKVSHLKVNFLNSKIQGNYLVDAEEIDKGLRDYLQEFSSELENCGVEVVKQSGQMLYLKGDVSKLEKVIQLKNIPVLLHMNDRLFYREHGYLRGFKKDRKATHNMTVFEIDCLRDTIEMLLDGEYEEAFHYLKNEFDLLEMYDDENPGFFFNHKCPKEHLLYHIKSSERFESYENGEKVRFFIDEKKAKEFGAVESFKRCRNTGRRYFDMSDKKTEKTVRYYVCGLDEIDIDVSYFRTMMLFKFKNLLGDLIGHKRVYNMLENDLSDGWYKKIASEFENDEQLELVFE
ncbi:hypothetical protein KY330_06110 [Candidatus Woesearchaeota archaeon]|nr:hypothetical protein [Candidatus Woesearchaeota archaeon]